MVKALPNFIKPFQGKSRDLDLPKRKRTDSDGDVVWKFPLNE
jgi:hypothetical protein